MWQVAGGHGRIDPALAITEMIKYHDAGFTTWDLADIYGPAEDFIGEFRQKLSTLRGEEAHNNIQALTKWAPQPGRMTRSIVKESIDRSLHRMSVSAIDLLQFHWWDYNNPYYVDALEFLSELRDEGKIRHIGLTNFDTERMQIMKDLGLKIVSNQVQYSIIDRRPEARMLKFCRDNNVNLLTYGTICGGLLSKRYIGRNEPTLGELDTLSLRKYKRMIDAWGGWHMFQELLSILENISKKYGVGIANIATRYILDKPSVAGVIIGVRLGIANHREDNARAFNFRLEKNDLEMVDSVCIKSNNLFELIGDCGDEYR